MNLLHVRLHLAGSLVASVRCGLQCLEDHIVDAQYLPDDLVSVRFYEPAEIANEKTIRERLAWWDKRLCRTR